jgi:hypothetical protein
LRELNEVVLHLVEYLGAQAVVKLGEDLRHYEIAELVLDVFLDIAQDVFNNDLLGTLLLGVLDQSFHDAKSLLILCKHLIVFADLFKQVMKPLFAKSLVKGHDDFLDHVVTLLVHCQLNNVVVLEQRFLDDLVFLLLSYGVDEILKCPSTMFVTRYLDKDFSFELLKHMNPLVNLSVFY